MKNILILYSICLMFTVGSFFSSAKILDEINNVPELCSDGSATKSSFLNELYSYEKIISVLSSMPFRVDQEEIEKAVSKMDALLVNILVNYAESVLTDNATSNEAIFDVLVECESPEAANGLMQGVGRLINWEMHNGLSGIQSWCNESLPEGDVEFNITGLRGILDIILVLNDDCSSYASLYCPNR